MSVMSIIIDASPRTTINIDVGDKSRMAPLLRGCNRPFITSKPRVPR